MDSITEAYNRMYLPEAAGAAAAAHPWLQKFVMQTITRGSVPGVAAGVEGLANNKDYQAYIKQGYSPKEAKQKMGAKFVSEILGGTLSGGAATLLGIPSGPGAFAAAAAGSGIGANLSGKAAADFYDRLKEKGIYDPEFSDARSKLQRQDMGVNFNEKTGKWEYDKSRAAADGMALGADFSEKEARELADRLNKEKQPNPGTTVSDQEYDELRQKNDPNYDGPDGDRVIAPKGGVMGSMIPGRPDTWKPADQARSAWGGGGDTADQLRYQRRRGVDQIEKDLDSVGIDLTKPEDRARLDQLQQDASNPDRRAQAQALIDKAKEKAGIKPKPEGVGRNWQNPYGAQGGGKPSEGNFRDQFPQGNSELDDIINEPYTADQNIPPNKPGDVIKPEDVKKPEDKEGKPEQKPEDKEGGKNLTPMQQWAQNYPALAAKVKPGQAGYDEIQALKKPQGGATQSSVQQRAQQLQQLRTGKAETPVATAASLYKKPEEKLGNANNPMATPRPGGLMSKLQDYQNEKGYGDNKVSAQQNDSSRFSRAPQQPQQAKPMPQYGNPGMSNTERQARRGAEAVVDTVTDSAQGISNAAQRAWQSNPAEKVKDAVKDTARSATVQTVKNQGQKALGALNNKRKEWTKPLGQ